MLVDKAATLRDVEQKLRDVWLECCAHLSSFSIGGRKFESYTGDYSIENEEEIMDIGVNEIFSENLTGEHTYDYGSPTFLEFKVIGKVPYRTKPGYDVEIVARNKAPDVLCYKCGKKATKVWLECMYDGGNDSYYCDECYEKEGFDEEMWLPVVNSPRCGVCGYCGGLKDDMC